MWGIPRSRLIYLNCSWAVTNGVKKNVKVSSLFLLRSRFENLTIDEQLYHYPGRTGFTQYIPSKTAKYGIKIWWIFDAKNAYPLYGIIYTGKTDTTHEKNQCERELAASYGGSGGNICIDNFFITC